MRMEVLRVEIIEVFIGIHVMEGMIMRDGGL